MLQRSVLLLTTVIFSGIATAVYAADDGFYAGVQVGYGDSGYSKNNLLPSGADAMGALNQTLVNTNNINDPVDIYNSTLSISSTNFSSSGSPESVAGRLFAGYQFNSYFSLEMGYFYLPQNLKAQAVYSGSGQIVQYLPVRGLFDPDRITRATSGSFVIKNQVSSESVTDFAAKFSIPIEDTGFNPYVKLGIAYVDTSTSTTIQNVNVNVQGIDSSQVKADPSNINSYINQSIGGSALCPEGVLGIDYDITNNVSVEASWSFIKGNHDIQDINFAGAGIIYHFE